LFPKKYTNTSMLHFNKSYLTPPTILTLTAAAVAAAASGAARTATTTRETT
jgi:hypothetical protein